MNILVLGGTRFFGIELVKTLLKDGHHVTIATRGQTVDDYGNQVKRIKVDRNDFYGMKKVFEGKSYDVVYDFLAYCSDAVKIACDSITCQKYILISSTAVYDLHMDTSESDYDPYLHEIRWGKRDDFDYDEGKRQAEAVLVQKYLEQDFVIVRYPVVLGMNDYTQRLYSYVQHIYDEKPIMIDNIDSQLSFILASEAGQFLAFLANHGNRQIYNGSALGTISLKEIIEYIEKKTGKRLVSYNQGENAPYNGIPAHSINTQKAQALGFDFQPLKDWIFTLINKYISLLDKM